MTPRQRQGRQTTTYRELIGIAEEVVVNARTAAARLIDHTLAKTTSVLSNNSWLPLHGRIGFVVSESSQARSRFVAHASAALR
jgi:hypothetical protein